MFILIDNKDLQHSLVLSNFRSLIKARDCSVQSLITRPKTIATIASQWAIIPEFIVYVPGDKTNNSSRGKIIG